MTMTREERQALDPEKQLHMNPAFLTAFPRWSEPLRNTTSDLARLERFLPRESNETDANYIARAEGAGMVITLSSPEVRGDVRLLDTRMTEAGYAGVPLMLVTDAAPDHHMRVPTAEQRSADEARKAQILDDIRHPERAKREAEFSRQLAREEVLRMEHNARVDANMAEAEADAARKAAGLGAAS
jgi:hypothetical protein